MFGQGTDLDIFCCEFFKVVQFLEEQFILKILLRYENNYKQVMYTEDILTIWNREERIIDQVKYK